MANAKKVVRKKKKTKAKRSKVKTASKVKSDPKAPKLKIKSSKGASMGKNDVPAAVCNTAAIAPQDYEHIYNLEKAKQNPEYVGKVKDNLAAGVGLSTKVPMPPPATAPPPVEAGKEVPTNAATKVIAPDDYVHIYNAKENVINGVKVITIVVCKLWIPWCMINGLYCVAGASQVRAQSAYRPTPNRDCSRAGAKGRWTQPEDDHHSDCTL